MKMRNKLSFKITILMIIAFVIVLSIQMKQGVDRYIDNYITMNSMMENSQFIDISPITLCNELEELYKEQTNINDPLYLNYIESKASLGNDNATTKYYIVNKNKEVLRNLKETIIILFLET